MKDAAVEFAGLGWYYDIEYGRFVHYLPLCRAKLVIADEWIVEHPLAWKFVYLCPTFSYFWFERKARR